MIFGLIGLLVCVCGIIFYQNKLKKQEKIRLEKENQELKEEIQNIEYITSYFKDNKDYLVKSMTKELQCREGYKKHQLSIGDNIKLKENI